MKRQRQDEFSRQAEHMASAPAFRAEADLQRLVKSLGDCSSHAVLDLACGPGIVAEAIAPHVRHVIGIDATPEMIRMAEERFKNAHLRNGRFKVALAEELPFHAGRFDQVITRLSFHHFVDLPGVISQIRRVLRPEGRLVVADVVSSEDPEEAALHNSLEQLRDPTHVRMLSASGFLEALRIAGFRVVHHESWRQARSFPEWAAIIADPARTQPLGNVMRALARAGLDAGIDLREESGELRFAHTWLLGVAEPD
jgi:ubiquinone/menaquinone biosynthesis C-methylase UbiE